MKKTYNTPEIWLTAVFSQDVITASVEELYSTNVDPFAQDEGGWNL